MSGHETIRVLEVEVDGSQSSSASDGKSEGKADEGSSAAGEQPAARSAPKSVTVSTSAREAGNNIRDLHTDCVEIHAHICPTVYTYITHQLQLG